MFSPSVKANEPNVTSKFSPSITLAAGHFKETRKGAWLEAFINLTLSIILVFKFGIVGVAIGTLVAMIIRTAEFMYHTSKYILKRSAQNRYNFYSVHFLFFLHILSLWIYW